MFDAVLDASGLSYKYRKAGKIISVTPLQSTWKPEWKSEPKKDESKDESKDEPKDE